MTRLDLRQSLVSAAVDPTLWLIHPYLHSLSRMDRIHGLKILLRPRSLLLCCELALPKRLSLSLGLRFWVFLPNLRMRNSCGWMGWLRMCRSWSLAYFILWKLLWVLLGWVDGSRSILWPLASPRKPWIWSYQGSIWRHMEYSWVIWSNAQWSEVH